MIKKIVKVRGRTGTSSFDLTIPVKIAELCDLHQGDVFEVSIDENSNDLKLVYTLIYKNR